MFSLLYEIQNITDIAFNSNKHKKYTLEND